MGREMHVYAASSPLSLPPSTYQHDEEEVCQPGRPGVAKDAHKGPEDQEHQQRPKKLLDGRAHQLARGLDGGASHGCMCLLLVEVDVCLWMQGWGGKGRECQCIMHGRGSILMGVDWGGEPMMGAAHLGLLLLLLPPSFSSSFSSSYSFLLAPPSSQA